MLLSKATYICATYNVYTFYIYTDGSTAHQEHQGFSVLLKDASTGNRTSNLLITKRLLYLLYHCRPTALLAKSSFVLPSSGSPWVGYHHSHTCSSHFTKFASRQKCQSNSMQ